MILLKSWQDSGLSIVGIFGAMVAPMNLSLIIPMTSSLTQPVTSSFTNEKGDKPKRVMRAEKDKIVGFFGFYHLLKMLKAITGKGVTWAKREHNKMEHNDKNVWVY